jgi:hypothetical protein
VAGLFSWVRGPTAEGPELARLFLPREAGLSDAAFGIGQKLPPHAHELKFEVVMVPEWDEEPLMEGWYELRMPAYPGEYGQPDL